MNIEEILLAAVMVACAGAWVWSISVPEPATEEKHDDDDGGDKDNESVISLCGYIRAINGIGTRPCCNYADEPCRVQDLKASLVKASATSSESRASPRQGSILQWSSDPTHEIWSTIRFPKFVEHTFPSLPDQRAESKAHIHLWMRLSGPGEGLELSALLKGFGSEFVEVVGHDVEFMGIMT
ncbi:hypothetical protein AC578_8511 [Pseudocercospora eumusae]|uniref:Uncharacterized protein n=1 Tax=Pseudocercospora eumusae TaxID=321146 RepID=A0A139HW62_9PEZI|nr:hypothetical protein AC578_8511 [Pseudocercospora eumusae]